MSDEKYIVDMASNIIHQVAVNETIVPNICRIIRDFHQGLVDVGFSHEQAFELISKINLKGK